MKGKFKYLLSIMALVMFLVCCSDGDDDAVTPNPVELTDNEYTNYWIYDQMKRVYLWNDELPASPDYTKDPESFFYNILYNYGTITGDRFSWIETDQSKKTKSSGTGIGFKTVAAAYFPDKHTENSSVGLFVISVVKGSDAEAKGLKRGNIIYAVNGTTITSSNYSSILNNTSFTLSIYDGNGEKTTLETFYATTPEASPIYMSDIIEVEGNKIGYIKYDAFTRSPDDDTSKFDYDIELMQSINELNSENISDFILDLRYNPGGYVSSALLLASALVPNRKATDIFAKEEFNSYFQDSLVTKYGQNALNEYLLDNLTQIGGSNLEVPKSDRNRVFILANEYSASASELVIHCLKPYMEVIHIGETTVGKDKGSVTVSTDDERIKWQLQPLVMRIKDKNGVGGYINGIDPTYEVIEREECFETVEAYYMDGSTRVEVNVPVMSPWKGGMKEYGDPSDPLIAEAIAQITGIPRTKSVKSASDGKIRKVPHLKQDESNYRLIIDENRFEKSVNK